jgi:hypothetical protein
LNFWIWIPVLDSKKFGPDLDTGSGSQKFWSGFGYRIRIPKNFCWIWIPDLDPKNFDPDLDTGSGSQKNIVGFGYRLWISHNSGFGFPDWIPKIHRFMDLGSSPGSWDPLIPAIFVLMR